MTAFPRGAWVRAHAQSPILFGPGATEPLVNAGEIIAVGQLGRWPAYRVRFAQHHGYVWCTEAECYQCGARDDHSHDPFCALAPQYREQAS